MNIFIVAATVVTIILLAVTLKAVGEVTRVARVTQTVIAAVAFFVAPVGMALASSI